VGRFSSALPPDAIERGVVAIINGEIPRRAQRSPGVRTPSLDRAIMFGQNAPKV
jgi:hypothetical protein